MRKLTHYILLCVMLLFSFVGCDVHEFPEERGELVPFTLHLNFDTDMPFHTEVPYTRDGYVSTKSASKHDFRYLINAYRTDNVVGENYTADTTFVFTRSEFENLDYTARFELPEGTYNFVVWCDYVDAGTTCDKYYNTSKFDYLVLASETNHAGSNDYRDAFCGDVTATVTNPAYYMGEALAAIDNSATVELTRPMGRFEFISTDLEVFLTRVLEMLQQKGTLSVEGPLSIDQMLQTINLGEMDVVFTYEIFMPCAYNIFEKKVAYSWNKTSFKSKMQRLNATNLLLGHDLVFVRDTGTTLSVSVAVYNKDGELMSLSRPVDVPIVPSKYTTVKGEFLTTKASGGISIKPGYDGDDYNIDITIK